MSARTAWDALLGAVYLVVIAALIAVSIAVFDHAFTDYTTVTLQTDKTGNTLQKGSDVKVRGVLVGSVRSIDSNGSTARVHLDLDPARARQLPANVSALLLPKTLFGERFVALQLPREAAAARLRSGDVIDQDRSGSAVEVQQVFDHLLPVLTAVRPEQLSATLGEVAAALRDRGSTLAGTLRTVGTYFGKFAPYVPQLTDDLGALARVADTYTSAGPDIIDALDDLGTTSTTIFDQRGDLKQLLASVASMSDVVRSFVSDNSDDIIDLAGISVPSLQLGAQYAEEFPCLFRALQAFVPASDTALGGTPDQPGAQIRLHVIPRVAPYTPADVPTLDGTGPTRCPYVPPTGLAGTSVAGSSQVAGAGSTTDGRTAGDLGLVNSPQENELIAEIVATRSGTDKADVPGWASLVLGPALRGTALAATVHARGGGS